MTTLDEIKDAVRRLSRKQRDEFRAWYIAFDNVAWDLELAADAATGRLQAARERSERAALKRRGIDLDP